nr:tyrosine-type recombinase/integrase [Candidatus Sigynarchaeum springense]
MNDLVDLFVLKQTHLAKTTKRLVTTVLAQFIEFCGSRGSPADIPDIQYFRYLDSLTNGGTYNHRLSVLNRFRVSLGKPRLDASKRHVDELDINPSLVKENYECMTKVDMKQRDRVILAILRYGGLRAGELCSIRYRDVSFDDQSVTLSVTGKTGRRQVCIVEVTQLLADHMNHVHGTHNQPIFTTNSGKQLVTTDIDDIFRRLESRAHSTIHMHPHLLRHLRATELATVLTEPRLRHYFGWTKNSTMPARYVHLGGTDVNDAIKEIAGLVTKREPVVRSANCPRCGYQNTPDVTFCGRCGYNLRVPTKYICPPL